MPPKNSTGTGKDIRSFFTSISPKATASSSAATGSSKDEELKKKKKPTVIESDSDSDGPFIKKPKKEPTKSSKTSTSSATSSKPSKLASKKKEVETPLKPVDIKDVFGSNPIQRSKEVPEKRKRPVVEDHEYDDFTATLNQLDGAPPKKSKTVEKPKNGKSPEKKEPVKIVSPETSPEISKSSKENEKALKKNGKSPSKDLNKAIKMEVDSPKKNGKHAEEIKHERRTSPRKSATSQAGSTTPVKKEAPKAPTPNKVVVETKKTPAKKGKTGKRVASEMTIESPVKKEEENLDSSVISSPTFDPLDKRKQKAENYRKFLAHQNQGAKNPGSKVVPEGAEGCLSGLTVVVTGVLESLHRDEAEELVKRYGGKATKSISRNTSHVLAGDDAGPAKLAKAKELNLPVISEDDFLQMIATRPGNKAGSSPPSTNKASGKAATPKSTQKATSARKIIKPEPEPAPSTSSIKKESAPPAPSTSSSGSPESIPVSLPWVDKYKPSSVKNIIGLQGDRSNAKKLQHWLTHWYENHSGHKKLVKPSPWSTNDDGAYFKAALLSGPPGIGKTTSAHLVAKELGFDIVEMNASDTRSKRLLHEHVKELLSCRSLASFAHGSAHMDDSRKRVLVMDEVDGMAGTEDRGGMQELIGLIKSSKIPIICICNDRQHQKVRSLANYCYDLKFSKPRVEQIRGAMMSICFKEGLKIKPEALDEIILGSNQDIRQVLHHLSMLASTGKGLTTEQAKVEASKSKKDLKIGPFEVVRKVFSAEEHRTMSLHDKTDLFFQDYSFGPLFAQENYPYVSPHASRGNPIKTLDLLARTAHCFSETDLIEKVIRSQNSWSLLPVEAVFASVVPGQLMEGTMCGQITFPSWLGKNSRTNKMDRLLQELQIHTRLRISASKRSFNIDYLPHLLQSVVGPLRKDGAQGVESAVHAMEEYDLLREDLDSLLELSQWPNKPDIMAGIDSKVKAAFTRAYNKEAKMTPYAVSAIKKGRGGKAAEDLDLEGDEGNGEEDEEEEDDDIASDAMIKVKKPSAKKTEGDEKKKKPASRGARGGRGGKK